MKIKQLDSNLYEVTVANGVVLFSFETPVAAYFGGDWLISDRKWSNATAGHINKWLDANGTNKQWATPRPQQFFDNLLIISERKAAC